MESTHSTGYAFQIEMTYRTMHAHGRIEEVPIAFTDRVRGTSKMSGRIVGEAMTLVTLWGLRDRVLRKLKPDRGPARDLRGARRSA
jgi:dolichol-phosphate mannosyltransferase